MQLDMSFETSPSSSSQKVVRGRGGRWRDAFGKFAKKKMISVHTNTDLPEAEFVPVLEAEFVPVPEAESQTVSNVPNRMGTAFNSVKQVLSFSVMAIGLVGGIYALLRLIGCELVDDSFEIIIRRK